MRDNSVEVLDQSEAARLLGPINLRPKASIPSRIFTNSFFHTYVHSLAELMEFLVLLFT